MPRLTSSYGERGSEDIRRQNNRGSQLMQARIGFQNKAPVAMYNGDLGVSRHPRGALFALPGNGGTREYFVIPRDTASNLGTQEGTGVPTTTGFPNNGDYGWWVDAAAGKAYWVLNNDGIIYYATSTASGINFTDITGELSDTQHGDRGRITGGNPMHTNATATEAGFLSTTFFSLLNGATASATASTLVQRNGTAGAAFGGTLTAATISASANITTSAGDVSATTGNITAPNGGVNAQSADMTNNYAVNGSQVVGPQDTGWTSQTATPSKADLGATPTVGAIAQWAAAVQGALETHGLFGP
jgi:hypothetical protein